MDRDNRGSITIEASLIFPLIFILLITFIFLSIYIYQKVTLYYIASQAAERAAFVWNNSYKDPITGEFLIEKNDGLYWRITDDRMLEIFLGSLFEVKEAKVQLGKLEQGLIDEGLPYKKLKRVADIIPQGVEGTITYSNHLLERTITVELDSPLQIPTFVGNVIGSKITAKAKANIIEPVEFIRTIDFIRVYGNWLIKNKEKSKGILFNRD